MSMTVALIGCGRWGSNHLAVLQRLKAEGAIKRLCVCDINPAVVRDLDVDACYTSIESLLANEDLTAAAVVTPPATHLSIAERLLQAGVPMLVEKPLSDDHDSTMKFLNTFENHSPPPKLVVGYLLRHHSGVKALADANVSGRLGPLQRVHYQRRTQRLRPSGATPMATLAVHGLDLVAMMLNTPLNTMEIVRLERTSDTALVELKTAEGAVAVVDVAWAAEEERRLFTVEGAEGGATLDFGSNQWSLAARGVHEHGTMDRGPLDAQWTFVLSTLTTWDKFVYPSATHLADQSKWLHRYADE